FPAVSQAQDKSGIPSALLSIAPAAGFPIGLASGYSGLSLSCSRLRHHPVAGALHQSDGHSLAAFAILHADNGCLRRTSFFSSLDPYAIVELQRQARKKNRVLRAAIFHNRGLAKAGSAAARYGYMHGNPNGPCLREKAC